MTTKEWLTQYMNLQAEINAVREAIAIMSAAAVKYKTGKSSTRQQFERVIKRDLEEQGKIHKAIDGVKDPRSRQALGYIYLCGYTVQKAADLMHYDQRTVARYENKGLEQIRVPAEYKQARSGCSSSARA